MGLRQIAGDLLQLRLRLAHGGGNAVAGGVDCNSLLHRIGGVVIGVVLLELGEILRHIERAAIVQHTHAYRIEGSD